MPERRAILYKVSPALTVYVPEVDVEVAVV